jgi:hypothetical protein
MLLMYKVCFLLASDEVATVGATITLRPFAQMSLRTNKPQTVRNIGKRVVTTRAIAEGVLPGKPAQLASAKLPKG